jgi:hypothetical protein
MLILFRLVYVSSALLAFAAGTLVTASLFIAERAPTSPHFLGVSLAVSAVFFAGAFLLLGIQHQVAAIALIARERDSETRRPLGVHVNRLLAYLLGGGAFLGAVLGLMTYAILARIDQGFAVFG